MPIEAQNSPGNEHNLPQEHAKVLPSRPRNAHSVEQGCWLSAAQCRAARIISRPEDWSDDEFSAASDRF